MPSDIRLAAVIGSGVMGSQIAAHITNAGVPSSTPSGGVSST